MTSAENPKNIVLSLPDIPRWIYARWMLLSGTGILFIDPDSRVPSMVVTNPGNGLTCIIGTPAGRYIDEAVFRSGESTCIIAYQENYDHVRNHLAGWTESPAILHTRDNPIAEKDLSRKHPVKFLKMDDLESFNHLPPSLITEFKAAIIYSKVAALYIDGTPVSFCYSAAETESLWDISIDTLKEYENRGYATECASFMIDHMYRHGKDPVWGAEIRNKGSMRLAEKLGFRPSESVILFFQ